MCRLGCCAMLGNGERVETRANILLFTLLQFTMGQKAGKNVLFLFPESNISCFAPST